MRLSRRALLAIDLQLAMTATFATVWLWLDSGYISVDCGWRFAPSCDACGSEYASQCAGSCDLLQQTSAAGVTSATPFSPCCPAVIVTSRGMPEDPAVRSNLAFLGVHVIDGSIARYGGRPVFKRYSTFLSYWNESGVNAQGARFPAGWRLSSNYRTQNSAIRQADGQLQSACPTDVSRWEYYDGAKWISDETIRVTCSQPAPRQSTCTLRDGHVSFSAAASAVWGGAVAIAFAARVTMRWLHVRSASRTYDIMSDANGPAAAHSRSAMNLSLALAFVFSSLVAGFAGWQMPLMNQVLQGDAKHFVSLGAAGLLSCHLIWLFRRHDEVVVMKRLQRRAFEIYSLTLLLWIFSVFSTALVVGALVSGNWDRTMMVLFILLQGSLLSGFVKMAIRSYNNRLRLTPLSALDDDLAAELASGAIRLLDADAFRFGAVTHVERRQTFELRHAAGEKLFVTPEAAVQLLKAGQRQIGFLTYGWRTPDHPDPDNQTLHAVVRALKSEEGQHIKALFWDCPCLWQGPRTPEQDAQFRRALHVMADGCKPACHRTQGVLG